MPATESAMEPVTVESQLAAIRAENKAIVKLLRKIKAKQVRVFLRWLSQTDQGD
jgi:hypothetical protein